MGFLFGISYLWEIVPSGGYYLAAHDGDQPQGSALWRQNLVVESLKVCNLQVIPKKDEARS